MRRGRGRKYKVGLFKFFFVLVVLENMVWRGGEEA
jgi:hypothetical protein